VMGEGAGFVVLQRLEDAAASGPGPLGLVLGHASTADAHHLVAPSPDGAGAVRCMELALADAGLGPSDLAHVHAHGTGRVLNARAGAAARAWLAGGSCPRVAGVRGARGHMTAGSGGGEAMVTLTPRRHRLAPPVAGLRAIDPGFDLDIVQGTPRQGP